MKDKFRSLICVIIGAILFTVFAVAIQAQTQGEITGLVTDASGAAVPNAEVRAKNLATGVVSAVLTNHTGSYNVA